MALYSSGICMEWSNSWFAAQTISSLFLSSLDAHLHYAGLMALLSYIHLNSGYNLTVSPLGDLLPDSTDQHFTAISASHLHTLCPTMSLILDCCLQSGKLLLALVSTVTLCSKYCLTTLGVQLWLTSSQLHSLWEFCNYLLQGQFFNKSLVDTWVTPSTRVHK